MKAYLSVAEIARITRKEKTTVQRWIRAGKLGNVRKVGNEYQVSHQAFRKWWAENMQRIEAQRQQKR